MPKRRCAPPLRWLGLIAGLIFGASLPASSAEDPTIDPEELRDIEFAPVIVDGETLFRVRGVSAFPAEQRAKAISDRIKAVASDHSIASDSLTITEVPQGSRISANDTALLVVLDADVQLAGADRTLSAGAYKKRIAEAIEAYRHDRTASELIRSGLYALAATFGLLILLRYGIRLVRYMDSILGAHVKTRLEGLEAQSLKIVSAARLWQLLQGLRYLMWMVVVLAAVVGYLDFVLHLFPWTRYGGVLLLDALVSPLRAIFESFIAALPDLVFLALLVWLTRYLLKAIRLPFAGIARGVIVVASFEREWALPTYRLVRMLVIALAVMLAYPHIPGSESNAFKGVSILLGLLISLGSSSLTGNVIAGYSLIYRRTFKVGDFVRIDQQIGEVVDSRLLATYLCTPKNEQIIIPNATVMNSSVVNYSTMARAGKLILPTKVGIGYEVPWRQVEAMLLQAAELTSWGVPQSKPFVLQAALGDYCVVYELNMYCHDPHRMLDHYAEIHRHILDVFNEYGVQIMTPSYMSDPPEPKIVPKDQWYAKPARPPEAMR